MYNVQEVSVPLWILILILFAICVYYIMKDVKQIDKDLDKIYSGRCPFCGADYDVDSDVFEHTKGE